MLGTCQYNLLPTSSISAIPALGNMYTKTVHFQEAAVLSYAAECNRKAVNLSKVRTSKQELMPLLLRLCPTGFVCCVTQQALNTSTAEGVGVQTPTRYLSFRLPSFPSWLSKMKTNHISPEPSRHHGKEHKAEKCPCRHNSCFRILSYSTPNFLTWTKSLHFPICSCTSSTASC